MSRHSFTHHLRLLILAVGVVLLSLDTFTYYQAQATRRPPEATIFEISPAVTPTPSPSTTSSPTPTATPDTTSRLIRFTQQEVADAARIEAAQHSFVGTSFPVAATEIAIYQLDYEILGKDGTWQPVMAQVFIPLTPGKYPLYVFGSGTTGLADKCRPSLENMAVENLGNYRNHMIAQASQGYVAVFPDYEGFHNADATQAYFIVESEAKTLLGAIRELQNLQSTTQVLQTADLDSVFLAGYSQGGHAALSAAREWQRLPVTTQLKGVIQFAGAADVEALFLESPWLASYLVASYVEYYAPTLTSDAVLQDRWLQEMRRNNEILCVNQAYRYYPKPPSEIYTPAFLDALESRTWPSTLANWEQAIRTNIPLSQLPDVPYVSIQGESDPIVTAQAQRRNTQTLCQQNKRVYYREYAGVNHFQIRQASFSFTNDWMKQVLAGQTLPSSCQ
jgi:predicted esterase